MRIRLVSNYASSEQLTAEVQRQWKPIENSNVEFVFDNSYEKLFIFNDWGEIPFVDKENIYVIAQEPSWSENYRDWNGRCAEFIAPVNGNYPYMFYHHGLSWQEVEAIDQIKTKKLSWVCAKGPDIKPAGTLYDKRDELFLAFAHSDIDIDLYGRGWDADLPKYKGELARKADGLIDYEFSIACENSIADGYITEKVHDICACKAIPIDVTRSLERFTIEQHLFNIKNLISNTFIIDIGFDNNLLAYIHSKI